MPLSTVGRPPLLAIYSLSSFEMHDLSPFSEEEHERIVRAVNCLLHRGIAE
jgi:hypothetical protein